MKDWSGMMNMPYVLTQSSYIGHNSKLELGSMNKFEQISQEVTKGIFEAYSAIGVQPDDQGFLDIAVSCDGAWQRHGFTSLMLLELLLTYLLDYQLTLRCYQIIAQSVRPKLEGKAHSILL